MEITLLISIIGASAAIAVSVIGVVFTNKNNIRLQTRKLKEEHYIKYMESLHHLSSDGNKINVSNYVFDRDKLFLIANEKVIIKMLEYEEKAVGKANELHDEYLTALIKEIRSDLKLKDKNFPIVYLKKS